MNSEFTLASPNQSHLCRDFWNLAYQEIDKRESGRLRKRDENARQEIVAVRTFLSILEQQRSTPWS